MLGGYAALRMLAGVKTIMIVDDYTLTFRFKGSRKVNHCRIHLNGMDLVDLTIGQIRTVDHVPTYFKRSTNEGLYNDMVRAAFEDATGLTLIVPRVFEIRR